MTHRTQQEILDRMKEVEDDDFFGYQREDLVDYLTYENAKPYLQDHVTKKIWEAIEVITPKVRMIEYMEFAWEKANNKRGLSASRSLDHYTAWLWLDGDEELHKNMSNYVHYGKEKLILICEYLGLDSNTWDDGIRENE